MKNRSTALYILRLLLTCVLLFVALQRVNIESLVTILYTVNLGYLFFGMMAYSVALWFFAMRTQKLLSLHNMSSGVFNIFCINITSSFYTLIIPSDLAGGAIRWHKLSKVDGERSQVFSLVIIERVLDNFCWLFILLAASLSMYLKNIIPLGITLTLLLLIILGTIFGLFIIKSESLLQWLAKALMRFIPSSISHRIINIIWALQKYWVSSIQILTLLVRSLFINIIFKTAMFIIVISIVPQISFDQFLFVNIFVCIIAQFPIAIAGIGLNEMVYGNVLPMVGLTDVSALAAGVVVSLLNVFWALIGGFLELVGYGRYIKPFSVE